MQVLVRPDSESAWHRADMVDMKAHFYLLKGLSSILFSAYSF